MVQVSVEVIRQGGNDGSSDGGGDDIRMLYQSLSTHIFQYAHYVSYQVIQPYYVCVLITYNYCSSPVYCDGGGHWL